MEFRHQKHQIRAQAKANSRLPQDLNPDMLDTIFAIMRDAILIRSDFARQDIAEIAKTATISKRFRLDLASYLVSRVAARGSQTIGTTRWYCVFPAPPILAKRRALFTGISHDRTVKLFTFGGLNNEVCSRMGTTLGYKIIVVTCQVGLNLCDFYFGLITLRLISVIHKTKKGHDWVSVDVFPPSRRRFNKPTESSNYDILTGFPLFAARFIEALFPRDSDKDDSAAMSFLI